MDEDLIDLFETTGEVKPPPPFEFLTGPAGSGKTFQIQGRIREKPSYGILCATTGVAAVNLGAGVTTINSLLKYFDYESLKDSYITNRLNRMLIRLAEEEAAEFIILDEVSMMDGRALQILTNGLLEVNQGLDKPMGMILTGDFCQLPPVKSPWAFETTNENGRIIPSPIWEQYFAPNTTRLTKIWRQDNPLFLEALNGFRRGDGKAGAEALSATSAQFVDTLNENFDGTTILAKNDEVDRFNLLRLNSINATPFTLGSFRWAREPHLLRQWKDIPDKVTLKRGALVMILSNHPPDFEYVNGDLATIEEYDAPSKSLILTLKRNGEEIYLPPLTRRTHQRETPEHLKGVKPKPRSRREALALNPNDGSYWEENAEKWVVGEVYYYPVRLGWASTVHKCVAPGTLIPVADRGLVSIEDVRVGDLVDSGNGYRKVKNLWLTPPKPAFLIGTKRGLSLIMSKEHPILTTDGHFKVGIEEGDEVQVWRPKAPLGISLFGCILPSSEQTKRGASIRTPERMTSDLAWALGLLVGDGSYREPSDGLVEFHASDEELHKELGKVLKPLGATLKMRQHRTKKHSFDSWFVHKGLRNWLKDLGMEYVRSECKEVPWPILRSGSAVQCAFLRGLFDTDGSMQDRVNGKYKAPALIYATSSRKLAQQVHMMLLALGIPVTKTEGRAYSVRNGIKTYSDNPQIQLRVPTLGYQLFYDLIGFTRKNRKETLEKVVKRFRNKPPRDLFHADRDEVAYAKSLGIDIPMYDLEVEGQHSFVANGFVCHNSQGLTLTKIQVDSRNGFFKAPAMAYVSLSRCKTPEGLRIVGSPKLLEERCSVDPKVLSFL